jgi:hypothetical protein
MRWLLPVRGGGIGLRRRRASAGRGQLEGEAFEARFLGRGEPPQHDVVGDRQAGDDLGLCLDQAPVAVGGVHRQAGAVKRGVERGEVVRLDDGPGLGQELGAGALRLDPSAADDQHPVGDGLDLGQEVRREQHGAAAVGEAA